MQIRPTPPQNAGRNNRRNRPECLKSGFTLVEMLIAMCISGILVMLAAPSLTGYFSRQRLIGAAETVISDFVYARTEAIKQNRDIYFSLRQGSGNRWCTGVSTQNTCDCSAATSNCDLKVTFSDQFPSVKMTSSIPGGVTITIDRIRALPSSNLTVDFANSNNQSVRGEISPVGRVRTCKNGGDPIIGMPSC